MRVIDELGLVCLPMWSQHTAGRLQVADNICPDITRPEECEKWLADRQKISFVLAKKSLITFRRGFDSGDVLGVLCETDTGLRTAEWVAASLEVSK